MSLKLQNRKFSQQPFGIILVRIFDLSSPLGIFGSLNLNWYNLCLFYVQIVIMGICVYNFRKEAYLAICHIKWG